MILGARRLWEEETSLVGISLGKSGSQSTLNPGTSMSSRYRVARGTAKYEERGGYEYEGTSLNPSTLGQYANVWMMDRYKNAH